MDEDKTSAPAEQAEEAGGNTYYVRFWTEAAREDAERCLLRRRAAASPAAPQEPTGDENEVVVDDDEELLSYEDLFGFLVRRGRADRFAGEEVIAEAELLLADLIAQLLRRDVPKFVKRAAEREKKNRNKAKSGRPRALTPLQMHQIERADAVVKLADERIIPRFGVEDAVCEAFGLSADKLDHYRRHIRQNSLLDFLREVANRIAEDGKEAWAREVISDAGGIFRLAAKSL